MKFISWNVNGFRACLGKGFREFFAEQDADFFCLQETKMQKGQAEFEPEGYFQYWNSAEKKGYSGTAVFTKHKPLSVTYGIGMPEHDTEGRAITLEYDEFYLVCVYTPNAQRELARIDYRVAWETALRNYLWKLDFFKPVIYCGDLNVAHNEIDLKNPQTNHFSAGFSDEERGEFSALLDSGFKDTFRTLYPDEVKYTWWSYLAKSRERNVGWRIDYFVVSDRLMPRVKDSFIMNEVMGSDHCPVGMELTAGVLEGESEFYSQQMYDSIDLVTHRIWRKSDQKSVGFITEYKNNAYIEKTLVIGAESGATSVKDSTPGEMTVYMKSGEKYTFPCWTDTVYCEQFGVNVSADGKYIYAISDIKGLWCYTYDGNLVYKTRYTSAQDVFPRADGTAVCVTRSNIILLDESGKVLEKLRVSSEGVPHKISEKFLAASTGENTLAILDTEKFEMLPKIHLLKYGINAVEEACVNVSDKYIIISGRHDIKWVPSKERDGNDLISENVLCVLNRADLSLIKKINLDEIGMGYFTKATIDGDKITLRYQNAQTYERKTYEFTLE